jgi:hypothetical protein
MQFEIKSLHQSESTSQAEKRIMNNFKPLARLALSIPDVIPDEMLLDELERGGLNRRSKRGKG